MKYSEERIKEKLNEIGFLYDPELVYTHADNEGCHMPIKGGEYQYIMVTFKDNNNHIVEQKFYSSITPKKLTHNEGREIWNDIINKKNNIKLLMDKI